MTPRGGWGAGFTRLALATIRSLMLTLAVIQIADTMIRVPVAEQSLAALIFPIALLIGREGLRDA